MLHIRFVFSQYCKAFCAAGVERFFSRDILMVADKAVADLASPMLNQVIFIFHAQAKLPLYFFYKGEDGVCLFLAQNLAPERTAVFLYHMTASLREYVIQTVKFFCELLSHLLFPCAGNH